jgi:hypothetical protein
MNHDKLIWLMIRFSGLFLLIKYLQLLIQIPFHVYLMYSYMALFPIETPTYVYVSSVLTTLVQETGTVLAIVYFLFFGKIAFRIIRHFCDNRSDPVFSTEIYAEIPVRFVGLWGLCKTIESVVLLIACLLLRFVFHDSIEASIASGKLSTDARKLLEGMQGNELWSCLEQAILYGIITWYLLKKGKLFINLLGRVWTHRDNQPSETPAVPQGCP